MILHSGLCLHHYTILALFQALQEIHTNPKDIYRTFFTLPLMGILSDSLSLISEMIPLHLPCHIFHSFVNFCSTEVSNAGIPHSSDLCFLLSLTPSSLCNLRGITLCLQPCNTDFQIYVSRYLQSRTKMALSFLMDVLKRPPIENIPKLNDLLLTSNWSPSSVPHSPEEAKALEVFHGAPPPAIAKAARSLVYFSFISKW